MVVQVFIGTSPVTPVRTSCLIPTTTIRTSAPITATRLSVGIVTINTIPVTVISSNTEEI